MFGCDNIETAKAHRGCARDDERTVTRLGVWRWAEKGGSYRTVPRVYKTVMAWGARRWLFFEAYLYQAEHADLLVGDESVVSKAGKQRYGLARFFSLSLGKPIAGLAFFALASSVCKHAKPTPGWLNK